MQFIVHHRHRRLRGCATETYFHSGRWCRTHGVHGSRIRRAWVNPKTQPPRRTSTRSVFTFDETAPTSSQTWRCMIVVFGGYHTTTSIFWNATCLASFGLLESSKREDDQTLMTSLWKQKDSTAHAYLATRF
jgi:hypothetical protein